MGAPVGGGDVVLGVVKMLMSSHELDDPSVGTGAASIDLEGAASEGAASMPAPPGVAVGIGGADAADDSSGVGGSSQEEVVDNGPCGVKPALPGVAIGGADAVDHVMGSKCPGISHKDEELDGPCGGGRVGIGGIDGIGAAAAGYPAGVDLMGGAASIELGGAASMPAPPVGGADAVDMGGGGALGWYLHSAASACLREYSAHVYGGVPGGTLCATMAGGAAALGVPPSGAVRGSAFSCSTSSGAAPGGGHLGGHRGRCWGCWG